MTRREQAIEAASEALHADNCPEGDEHDGCDCADWVREAEVALTAALAVILPVVPNTVEALDQLPDGAVIRGVGHGGYATVFELVDGGWRITGSATWRKTAALVQYARWCDGITEWVVLHWRNEAGGAAGTREDAPRIAQEAEGALGDAPDPARPVNPKPESEGTR